MKLVVSNMKKIAIAAIVTLSCGYGVAQAYSLTHALVPGCIQCFGCGPEGGTQRWAGGPCFCCIPPSE
jgi:hypothetical protein